MARELFDRELKNLKADVITLGSEVESNLVKAAEAIRNRDRKLSRHLIKEDEQINARRIQIGMQALRMIATQQPLAGDMRMIATVFEVVGELERIHDYVKGVAKINLMLGKKHKLDDLIEPIYEMAVKSAEMLHLALEAFANRDAALANRIPAMDDAVDALFNETYASIIQHVIAHPESVARANKLEWAIHNLERSADRVINICEWVLYMVTGKYVEFTSQYEAPPM
jgi:phosphate transport system protein